MNLMKTHVVKTEQMAEVVRMKHGKDEKLIFSGRREKAFIKEGRCK